MLLPALAFGVCESPVIEHLQEDIPNVWVRFLDLID
jgi:hypothetical protein